MIVVGLDVHKHSLTAAAVDELGRDRGIWSGPVGADVLAWASSLDSERLWAVEDCRHVTHTLERMLVAAGERLVRVPPRLTAPQRRRSRTRGRSDAIDGSPSPGPRCKSRSSTVQIPAKKRCAS